MKKIAMLLGLSVSAFALSVSAAAADSVDAPSVTAGPEMTICQDANFSGSCQWHQIVTGIKWRDLGYDLGPGFQDSISSIRNNSNLKVTFYEHSNFAGRALVFPAYTQHSDLSQTGWANDVLSSLRVD
ncbi:peptidase inhibitor family I36 protein [Streptomyces sp. NPDC026673]|uniref:peptidase inhibitor family I36 protein n=1 Tax=Streptomyces sp. NPDC026673 TaxID=3155724 RepID=UPI0033DDAA1D